MFLIFWIFITMLQFMLLL